MILFCFVSRTDPIMPFGFNPRKREPCPDCLLRNDLDLLCRVKPTRYSQVKACAGCQGKGWVHVEKQRDPYWTGRGK